MLTLGLRGSRLGGLVMVFLGLFLGLILVMGLGLLLAFVLAPLRLQSEEAESPTTPPLSRAQQTRASQKWQRSTAHGLNRYSGSLSYRTIHFPPPLALAIHPSYIITHKKERVPLNSETSPPRRTSATPRGPVCSLLCFGGLGLWLCGRIGLLGG